MGRLFYKGAYFRALALFIVGEEGEFRAVFDYFESSEPP